MAAGLGVVTPFCSCSAVPAFIGFVAAGVPLGVTLSFLIASPLVNEIAIGLLLTLFGWQVTLAYVVAGVAIAIVAGWVLGRLRLERFVEPFVFETKLGGQVIDSTAGLTFDQRVQMGAEEVGTILRKIWPYLLVGHRPRCGHPRLGARGPLHPVRRPGQHLRGAGRRADRDPALLQRRRHPAARRGAARQGPADGDPARLHDGRRRALAARDDPAPPRPQAPAARHLRRPSSASRSSPSATCSTTCSPERHTKRNDRDHQDPRTRLHQLPEPRARHPRGHRRPRPGRHRGEGRPTTRPSPATA